VIPFDSAAAMQYDAFFVLGPRVWNGLSAVADSNTELRLFVDHHFNMLLFL